MGERTQMLVTIKEEGEVKCSVSLHYPWGYGRVMLMDALSLTTYIVYSYWETKAKNKEDLANLIFNHSHGLINFITDNGYSIEYYKKEAKDYEETMAQVIEMSDNDDGYAHLELEIGKKSENDSLLKLYNYNGKICSLNEYCKTGEPFTNKEFQNSFKCILEGYGIKIVNKKANSADTESANVTK